MRRENVETEGKKGNYSAQMNKIEIMEKKETTNQMKKHNRDHPHQTRPSRTKAKVKK